MPVRRSLRPTKWGGDHIKSQVGRLSKLRGLVFPACICAALWGSAYPCIKLGYEQFGITNGSVWDKIVFAGIRFTLAGLLTLLIYAFSHRALPKTHHLPAYQICALGLIFTSAQYVCFYLGLANSTGSRSAVLNAACTFFTVLLAAVFYRSERLTARKLIGCLIGFCGIVVMNLNGKLGGSFLWTADGLILLAALSFAVGSLLSKELSRREHPLFLSGAQMAFGGAVLLAVGFVGGGKLRTFTWIGVALLGYMIILSCVAFAIWTALLHRFSAGAVSVYYFLVPVFGVLLSAIFLHEQLVGITAFLSLALVCIGIFIVNYTPSNR